MCLWVSEISATQANISSLQTRRILAQVSTGSQIPPSQGSISICAANPTPSHAVSTASPASSHETQITAEGSNLTKRPRFRNQGNCLSRACSCRCHRTVRAAGRLWSFEYALPGFSSQTCDKSTCNTTRSGGAFRISLSKLGFQVLLNLQLHILTEADSGTRSLRPGLTIQSTVPYTSTGFEIIWRCRYDMMTFQDAEKLFLDFYRTDKSLKGHVNPGGKSYIEVSVEDHTCWSWLPDSQCRTSSPSHGI